jgi:outer membrane protein OmpA-like peptidoglycan-associated protein
MWTVLSLFIGVVWAQEGLDASGAALAPQDGDARDPLLLQRPGVLKAGEVYTSALLEGAKAPLVLVTTVDGEPSGREAALDDLFGVDLQGGYAVHDRLRLDLSVPLYLASRSLGEAQGAGLGDVRAASQLLLLAPSDESMAVGVGLVPWITLPTGDEQAFLGASGVVGGGAVNATVEAGRFTASGLAGLRFEPALADLNLTGSDAVDLGLSAGLLASDATGVSLELALRPPFQTNDVAWRGTPGELMLSARHRTDAGFHVVAGAGAAVTPALGTPLWRAVLGGGWSRLDREHDLDGDGVANDQCPEEAEVVNGWRDDDGCPDTLADLVAVAAFEGTDYPEADIVLSSGATSTAFDFGPARVFGRMPGESWHGDATMACMVGGADIVLVEGDNRLQIELEPQLDALVRFVVVDENDEPLDGATLRWVAGPTGCAPSEMSRLVEGRADITLGAGDHEVAGTAEGYETRLVKFTADKASEQEIRIQLQPTRVNVDDQQIKILEKVHFETNSHVIKGQSYGLLSEVAATIVSHPEFGRVEVQGHADERGPDEYNLHLSARRARAVADYLIKEGVAAKRLVVHGYGEERPLVEGSGEAAWSENRRVQFSILGFAEVEGAR